MRLKFCIKENSKIRSKIYRIKENYFRDPCRQFQIDSKTIRFTVGIIKNLIPNFFSEKLRYMCSRSSL